MKQIFALQTISNLNVICQFIEILTLNLIEILCGNVRKCVKSSHWIFYSSKSLLLYFLVNLEP